MPFILRIPGQVPGRYALLLIAACAFPAAPARALQGDPASGAPGSPGAAGFTSVQVLDPQGPPLDAGIWYPTTAQPSVRRLGLFTRSVAPDGPVETGSHPLVVIRPTLVCTLFHQGSGREMVGFLERALRPRRNA